MREVYALRRDLPPANRCSGAGVNERFVGGQIGDPFAETDIDEFSRLGMGILNRLQQGIPAALSQLVLDGLGDEPTAVSLESIDLLHEIGW